MSIIKQLLNLEKTLNEESVESNLEKLKDTIEEVKKLTTSFNRQNAHLDLIAQVKKIAEDAGLSNDALKYEIDEIFENHYELSKSISNLVEPFEHDLLVKSHSLLKDKS